MAKSYFEVLRIFFKGVKPHYVIAQGKVKRSPESNDSYKINPERVTLICIKISVSHLLLTNFNFLLLGIFPPLIFK